SVSETWPRNTCIRSLKLPWGLWRARRRPCTRSTWLTVSQVEHRKKPLQHKDLHLAAYHCAHLLTPSQGRAPNMRRPASCTGAFPIRFAYLAPKRSFKTYASCSARPPIIISRSAFSNLGHGSFGKRERHNDESSEVSRGRGSGEPTQVRGVARMPES